MFVYFGSCPEAIEANRTRPAVTDLENIVQRTEITMEKGVSRRTVSKGKRTHV
jgi:hypothetical protein